MRKMERASDARVYAVGDIHGHYDNVLMMMQGLVDDGFDVTRDTVVFLGDYIDRGPKSVDVLQFLFELRGRLGNDRVILLPGNHEVMASEAIELGENSDAWQFWMSNGGLATIDNAIDTYSRTIRESQVFVSANATQLNSAKAVLEPYLDQLVHSPPVVQVGGGIFAHAAVSNGPDPLAISRHNATWDRRYLQTHHKHEGKRVVIGHTPHRKPFITPSFVCIDTILYTQLLTAVRIDEWGRIVNFVQASPGAAWSLSPTAFNE